MDSSRKLRILVACVFLLMNGIGGQLDGDMKICEMCNMEGLPDCNFTNMIHINMTVNCELTVKMCVLGIDPTFEAFDNLTIEEINQEQVCLLRDGADTTPSITATIPTITGRTEGYEHLKTTTEGTLVEVTTIQDFLDYQGDQPTEITIRTFRSDPGSDPLKKVPPPPHIETMPCLVCKNSSNEACIHEVDKLQTINCPKENGCIALYIDGNIIRDCASSIPPEDVELCHKPDNMSCDVCTNPMCNKMAWKQCYQCNSKDNPNCALWSNVDTISMSICPNYNDNCLVRITTDGDTVRECSRADFKCAEGELCSICDTNLCNSGVYPEDRRQCIQCQECEDAQDPSVALPCARYKPDEQCFLYVTAKSRMIRGCVSNINEMHECQMNEPKCITCGDTNGCNSMPLMKDATLSCSKCNSKDNASCAWAQPTTTVAKCKNKVLYYLQETCMTEFDPVEHLAVRDCSFDFGACTPEDYNCRTCSGDGCNRDTLMIQHCIQCNSAHSEQIKCGCRAEGIAPSKCAEETQTYETKGCYSMTRGNITTRGCIAGLTEESLKFCKVDGKAHCDLCMEDGCNNQLAPSRGGKIHHTSLLFVIGSIFAII